jgi:hypothetical protein
MDWLKGKLQFLMKKSKIKPEKTKKWLINKTPAILCTTLSMAGVK